MPRGSGLVLKPATGSCIVYDGGLHHAAHPVLEGTRTTAVFHLKKKVEEGAVGRRLADESWGVADPMDGSTARLPNDGTAEEGAGQAQRAARSARGRAWRVVSSRELTRGLNERPLRSALVARAGFRVSEELPMATWKERRRQRKEEREAQAHEKRAAPEEGEGEPMPKDEV